MASITNTATVDASRVLLGGDDHAIRNANDFATRLRRARLGLIVAITAVVMIFVSYSSAYIVRQGLPTLDPRTGTLVHDWLPLQLPRFLLINTLVLLVSTLTMELARRQAIREATAVRPASLNESSSTADGLPWIALTGVLGLSFLAGQWLVWRELAARGFYLSTSPSSSFFYVLTGTHGVHLLGGIIALLVAAAASLFFRETAATRGVMVDVTAWYWHFMTFLWVYLLCLLKFAR